jgi:two-component system OmpR family response regulator
MLLDATTLTRGARVRRIRRAMQGAVYGDVMGVAKECQVLDRVNTEYMPRRDAPKGFPAAIDTTQWLYPKDPTTCGPTALRILLIDHDSQTVEQIASGFDKPGQRVETAADGQRGLMLAVTSCYDVIILDRHLPGMDGLSVVRTLRETGTETPILFLTHLSGVNERVAGLDAGADDYLLKPFDVCELMARVRALSRRPPIQRQQTILRVADLEVNLISRTVMRAGCVVELLPREFALLELFMRNEGRVLTRSMLLDRIWNFHFDPRTSVVETHISRLRAKIDRCHATALIHTVRGRGYSLYALP